MNGERKEDYLDRGKLVNNERERRKALRRLLKASLLRELSCKSEHGRRRRTCHRVGPKCLSCDMKSDDEDNAEKKGQARGAPNWNFLPHELLLKIFRFLPPDHLMQASQVCQFWNTVGRDPILWRNVEITLGTGKDSTSQDLVQFILNNHRKHLKSLVFKADSSRESAEKVCHILKRLVHCSLRTLAVISCAAPVFLDIDYESFTSGLDVVFDHPDSIRNLAVDYTPIDDPSLKKLARNHSKSLQQLKMKSCPRISPEGVLWLTDNCRRLRELSLNYAVLTDDILRSLSSEQHVKLTHLRIDVFTDPTTKHTNKISTPSWQTLIKHSPNLNLIIYFFVVDAETYDLFFNSYNPVSHIYFCEYVPKNVLQRISRNCPRVRELVVNGTDGPTIDIELIDLGLHCDKLTSIGLSDCFITCSAFVEFVRISCKRLSELFISEDCLVQNLECDLQNVILSVSELLCMNWEPEFTPLW